MKKIIIAFAVFAAALNAQAQKSNIKAAERAADKKNYDQAISAINEATANPETKDNPDTWFTRGHIYLLKAVSGGPEANVSGAAAAESFVRLFELKPNYDPEQANNMAFNSARFAYNAGVESYQKQEWAKAYEQFNTVAKLYKSSDGKRFITNPDFATLAQSSMANAGTAAINNKQYDLAAPLLESLKNDAGAKDSGVYQNLSEVYRMQGNDTKYLSFLKESQQQFPNNQYFKDAELNYYNSLVNNPDNLPKLEAAVAAQPGNNMLLFNLANMYSLLAIPDTKAGQPMSAAQQAYFSKAEQTYNKLLAASPNDPDYNYNFGYLYNQSGTLMNGQVIAINNNKKATPADVKKSEILLKQRNSEFEKAAPYFTNAIAAYSAKSPLSDMDARTYHDALVGMQNIYIVRGDKVKTEEFSKKIKALGLDNSGQRQ